MCLEDTDRANSIERGPINQIQSIVVKNEKNSLIMKIEE